MPLPNDFPHLHWTFQGPFDVSFNGGRKSSPEAAAAKADRKGHSGKLRGQIDLMKRDAMEKADFRQLLGLPEIQGKGFLLRVPEGTDVDALAQALGVELVAETDSGLMFAASDTLDLEKLYEVLSMFENDARGGGGAASVLDVFHQEDDERKLSELLVGRVHERWPFEDNTIYTFDLGIQTAASSRTVPWTRLPKKRKDQTAEDRAKHEAELRRKDREKADETWMNAADERFTDLEHFIQHYGGVVLDGFEHDDSSETRKGSTYIP